MNCTDPKNELIIISPNKDVYDKTSTLLNLSSTFKLSKLEYVNNFDSGYRFTQLCTNCNAYSKLKTFKEGNNTLVVRGALLNGTIITNQTKFIIDTKDPQISTTKPSSMKYTNGTGFYVKYTEDHCQSLNLILNGMLVDLSCRSGKYIEESFFQNLSKYKWSNYNL